MSENQKPQVTPTKGSAPTEAPLSGSDLRTDDSAPPRTLKEFLLFVWARIRREGKWWLIPLWILLVILAILLVLSGNGALLPAIYLAF